MKVYTSPEFVLPCALTVNPNTGDVFVRWYMATSYAEVISRLSSQDGTIQEFYYTNGRYYGALDSLSSELEYVLPANAPATQSMVFDGIRNRLWWISNSRHKRVGMVDLLSNGGRNLTLYQEASSSSSLENNADCLTAIQFSEVTGSVYVGRVNKRGDTIVYQIDSNNLGIEQTRLLLGMGKPLAIFVAQSNIVLLPFTINGVTLPVQGLISDLPFTVNSLTAPITLAQIDHRDSESEDSSLDNLKEVADDINEVLVWAQDQQGFGRVKSSGLPNFPQETFQVPQQIIRLPIFSWGVAQTTQLPWIIVGDSKGNVQTFTLQETATPILVPGVSRNIIHGSGGSSSNGSGVGVTGLAIDQNDSSIAATYETTVAFLDPNSLATGATVYSNLESVAINFDNQHNAWTNSLGEGKIGKVNRVDLTQYGFFDSPQKTIYSNYHQKLFVMGKYTVYSFDPVSLQKQVVQAERNDTFVDLDVSTEGAVLLLSYSAITGMSTARVLESNLFTNSYEFTASHCLFQKGVFSKLGKAVVAGEVIRGTPEESSGMTSSSNSSVESRPDSSSSSSSVHAMQTIEFFTIYTAFNAI